MKDPTGGETLGSIKASKMSWGSEDDNGQGNKQRFRIYSKQFVVGKCNVDS